jgi:transposase InsO family protein
MELLRTWAGWVVNDMRVERTWRQEGLTVPAKQSKRGRLWLAHGSCVRSRATHRNCVWSYDFVEERMHDGHKYRLHDIVDENTHVCLAIRVSRRRKSTDVIDVLSDLFILHGLPGLVRSDNGSKFVAQAVQDRIAGVCTKSASIAQGSPWENGSNASFNAPLRDALLDGEIVYTLKEEQIVIESRRQDYNAMWPHTSLGSRAPDARRTCRASPRGRPRSLGRLRRPRSRWCRDRYQTDIPTVQFNECWSSSAAVHGWISNRRAASRWLNPSI